MTKTHFKYIAADARDRGQTDHEYHHQTACGYVRDDVTNSPRDVDCTHCLASGRVPNNPAPSQDDYEY